MSSLVLRCTREDSPLSPFRDSPSSRLLEGKTKLQARLVYIF